MSIVTDHARRCRSSNVSVLRQLSALRIEARGIVDDLGTVLLMGLCLAGVVIVASTFDGDLQGNDEVVAAVLGTLSLFGILAALELADRIKGKRAARSRASKRGVAQRPRAD